MIFPFLCAYLRFEFWQIILYIHHFLFLFSFSLVLLILIELKSTSRFECIYILWILKISPLFSTVPIKVTPRVTKIYEVKLTAIVKKDNLDTFNMLQGLQRQGMYNFNIYDFYFYFWKNKTSELLRFKIVIFQLVRVLSFKTK